MVALIAMIGNLLASIGQLRKLGWIQMIVLAGVTISAGALAWQAKQDWVYAAMAAAGAFLVQLNQLCSDPPGRVSLPDDHPGAPMVIRANQMAKEGRSNAKPWDPDTGA